jgi:NodT family efflux transporter outer membrane factor (OMF) lipoprotein
MSRLPLLLLLASVAGTGCIYSSNIKQQLPKAPKAFGAKASQKAPPVGRWWTVFKDPQLDRLMQQAFASSLDLQTAWVRLKTARASLMLNKSGYYPRVSAQFDGGRSHSKSKTSFGGQEIEIENDRNTLQLSLGAAYEIDLWGKVRYAAKAARFELKASQEDLRVAYISLAAQLTESYFRAAELRAQLKLLAQTIESRTRQVKLVERRYNEGVVTALDLYQAKGNLSGARSRRAIFASQLKITEHAIALLVGQPPARGSGATGSLDKLPDQVTELPPGLPAQLLLRRPDLRAVQRRLEAADASVGAAVAGHYPSVTLSASIGYNFDPLSLFWNLLGSITAPIFEGMRVKANVELKRSQLELALISYKAALLRALKEVEDALVSGHELQDRVKWLEQSVSAAEGALRMSTHQYEQGLINFLPVLTAEQSVYNARTELLSARRELVSARVQLARALGGSWMDKQIEARAKRAAKKDKS